MVSVVKRPQGHKLIDQAISAIAFSSFYFDTEENVLVNFTNHGLSNGDFVYVTSDIDEYNGFWEVEVFNVNAFYLTEGGVRVEYYQDVYLEYYQTQPHDWSAVFLPIIYKISNDKWPVNSADAVNLIVLNSDDNGFTELTLAAPLSANALEFIKISGASTPEANGVWQIVEVVLSNVLVIDLPFELSGSLIGASAQYYYNNYQVKVKIFAGLNASHPWANKKPYEEVAELSLTPDENNLVMFSVSDYIQSKVAIKNNLTLFSLPLNLDAFTGFKIQTTESYDASDGYSLYTEQSYFIEDDFEGYAIAGKLPFKNLYAGDYAEYVYTSGSPAKWLTVFERLLAVEGYFFDVSFIKNIEGEFFIRFTKYITSDYSIVDDVEQIDFGIGVYRIVPEINAAYESICMVARTYDVPEHTDTVLTPFNLSQGVNYDLDAPSGYDRWDLGPIPEQDIASGNQVIPIAWPFQVANGVSYTFQYTIEITTPNVDTQVRVTLRDTTETYPGSTFAGTGTKTHVGSGTFTDTITIVSSGTTPDVSLNISVETLAYSVRLLAFGTTEDVLFPATPGVAITEEICIDILEVCEVEGGFTPEGRRLTEDGGFRLLE